MSTEQYNEVCKEEFSELKALIIKQGDSMEDFKKRVLIGNGTPSHAMQLDRLNRFMTKFSWFVAAVSLSWIGILTKIIYEVLKDHV